MHMWFHVTMRSKGVGLTRERLLHAFSNEKKVKKILLKNVRMAVPKSIGAAKAVVME